MERVPEPELMDDPHQAAAYARADFSQSNQAFVDRLLSDCGPQLGNVVDIGCGPADVLIRFAPQASQARITAVDGSASMIALARQAVLAAGLDGRITPLLGRIPGLPLPPRTFDTILSKDLLHHLPDPASLWSEARRLGRSGAAVFVMDLFRPGTTAAARRIVETVAGNEDPVLKRDFYNSLRAAFSVEEVETQLGVAGLALRVDRVSERHMLIAGFLP